MELKTMLLDDADFKHIKKMIPSILMSIMEMPEWNNKVFIAGGFIRAIVAGEEINDVDVFVKSKGDALLLAAQIIKESGHSVKTFESANATTIKIGRDVLQIIHRWTFEKPEDILNSFDFTICCAVIYVEQAGVDSITWRSVCDSRFYIDLASKRLVYRSPSRNEDAGGSMLRVLKYYQRGYRTPLDCLGAVMARVFMGVEKKKITGLAEIADAVIHNEEYTESSVARVITSLLVEVDPGAITSFMEEIA